MCVRLTLITLTLWVGAPFEVLLAAPAEPAPAAICVSDPPGTPQVGPTPDGGMETVAVDSLGRNLRFHFTPSQRDQILKGFLAEWGTMYRQDLLKTVVGGVGICVGSAVAVGVVIVVQPLPWLALPVDYFLAVAMYSWAKEEFLTLDELRKDQAYEEIGARLAHVVNEGIFGVVGGGGIVVAAKKIPAFGEFLGGLRTKLKDIRLGGERPAGETQRPKPSEPRVSEKAGTISIAELNAEQQQVLTLLRRVKPETLERAYKGDREAQREVYGLFRDASTEMKVCVEEVLWREFGDVDAGEFPFDLDYNPNTSLEADLKRFNQRASDEEFVREFVRNIDPARIKSLPLPTEPSAALARDIRAWEGIRELVFGKR